MRFRRRSTTDATAAERSLVAEVRRSLALIGRPARRRYLLVVAAQMATSLLDLIGVALVGITVALAYAASTGSDLPAIVQPVLDRLGLTDQSVTTLAVACGLLAAVALLAKSALAAVLLRRIYRFLSGRQADVSSWMARQWFARDVHRVHALSDADVEYALTYSAQAATAGLLGPAAIVLTEVALLVVLSVALILVDPVATLLSAASFLVVALTIQRVLGPRARRIGQRAASSSVSARQHLRIALDSFRELQTARRLGFPLQEFDVSLRQAANAQASVLFVVNGPRFAYEAALVVSAALLAGWQLSRTSLPSALALLAVFLTAAARLLPSMVRLQGQLGLLAHSSGTAARAFALAEELGGWDETVSTNEIGMATPHPRLGYPGFSSSVHVDGLTVRYPGATEPALFDVSLTITPGSSVALIGPTGAGKSTLVDAVLGFVSPERGSVTIGGLTPRQVQRQWPGAVAYMPQESAMWGMTVRENVALGLPRSDIDDDAIWGALERAFVADDVRARGGLDAETGAGGRTLSGGQRQRLAIARALYSSPRLLVLDEATSALDEDTEALIGGVLDELRGTVTVIAVAHRRATIERADTVVSIRGGRIDYVGTPADYFADRR